MPRKKPPELQANKGFGNRHEFFTSWTGEVKTEEDAAKRPKIIVNEGSCGVTIESTCFTLPTLQDVQAFRELLGSIENRIASRKALAVFTAPPLKSYGGPRVVKLRTAALYGKLATPGTTARAALAAIGKGANARQRRAR